MKYKPMLIFLAASGVALWGFILLVLFSKCSAQQPNLHLPIWKKERSGSYEFANPSKFIGWGVLAIASTADGLLEGYQFDGRKSFERKWGKSPDSFFGSQSWRRVYRGGNPDNGFKSSLAKQTGAFDFYHVADDVRKIGYIGGGITLAIGSKQVNSKWWHYALDVGIGMAISAIAKRQAMDWVRH